MGKPKIRQGNYPKLNPTTYGRKKLAQESSEQPETVVTTRAVTSVPKLIGGSTASELRAMSRATFAQALPALLQRAPNMSDSDLARLADLAGKYGLGEAKVIAPEEFITACAELLGADPRIPMEAVTDFVKALRDRLQGMG